MVAPGEEAIVTTPTPSTQGSADGHGTADPIKGDSGNAGSGNTVRDPVCGMSVDPATARYRAEHAGRDYFFCSARCRERFTAKPARYLAPAAPTARATSGESLWTCPMHPQIVRGEPGSCPICGMALEPTTPQAGEAANPELADMTRRFWVGVVLSAPLLGIAMADHLAKPALDALIPPHIAVWVQLILATPAVLWDWAVANWRIERVPRAAQLAAPDYLAGAGLPA